jgi:hypothetical protein
MYVCPKLGPHGRAKEVEPSEMAGEPDTEAGRADVFDGDRIRSDGRIRTARRVRRMKQSF